MVRYCLSILLLSCLICLASCKRPNPSETDQSQAAYWGKIEDMAIAASKANLDSMLYYSSLLHSKAVKAKDPRWEAKSLVLLGYWNSLKGETDTSIILLQKAIKLGDSIQDSAIVEQAHNYLGSRYLGTGLFRKAGSEYLAGLAYAEKKHDTSEIVKYYNNLGNVMENLDNLGMAQEYMNKALTLSEKHRDTLTMASSMRNLAWVIKKSGDSVQASRYFRSSLALFTKLNNQRWVAKLYSDLGIFYRYQAPDSAYYYYKKAIEIYTSLGDNGTVLITEFNMANLLFDKGKYGEAEKIFSRIYKKTLETNNLIGMAYSSISLASTYNKLKDFPKADFFIQKSETLAAQWNQPDFTRNVYAYKIELLKSQGKYKEAVPVYEKYVNLKDSLSSAENKTRILELQNQFNSEKKEFEITTLKQQTTIQQTKLHNRSLLIISLVALIVVITLSMGVILLFYRRGVIVNQKLTMQSEELKKEIQNREKIQKYLTESERQLLKMNASKDKFFSIIAHDLKSPFNTIFGFTDLLTTDFQNFNKDEIKRFIENISNASKQAYALLENLLVWAQTQNKSIEFNPQVIDLEKQVGDALALVETQAKAKQISITSFIKKTHWGIADVNLIGTILRNLLSNAIKFTPQNGSVEVSALLRDKQVWISVNDTGVGISRERLPHMFEIEGMKRTMGTEKEKGSGLGLILCKEFAEMQGGRIWVESEPGKGSTFTFSVPAVTTGK